MGEVLDGATMILVEISFIMLWSGIVMGAIWADHSGLARHVSRLGRNTFTVCSYICANHKIAWFRSLVVRGPVPGEHANVIPVAALRLRIILSSWCCTT